MKGIREASYISHRSLFLSLAPSLVKPGFFERRYEEKTHLDQPPTVEPNQDRGWILSRSIGRDRVVERDVDPVR
jgi:hypothetical protein